jgi:hypothetical protein
MKVQIPEQLKTDIPQTTWGKILSATPVVMAVLATMLAGLASSEMTRAQYVRSLAAQQQSKAGDQWSFFQAKRLRGALQRNTVDLMQTMSAVRPLAPGPLKAGIGGAPVGQPAEADQVRSELLRLLDSAAGQQALGCLQSGETPRLPAAPAVDARVKAALEGLEKSVPDAEMATLLAPVSENDLEQAVRGARDQSQAFDLLAQPVNRTVDQMNELFTRLMAGLPALPPNAPELSAPDSVWLRHRDFTAARLRYTAARYEVEARLNQGIANLYELQVRKSNIMAQRHHLRSQRFFFGMLGAQLGVIVSTLAMAARKQNLLWSVAAAAGLLALVFAIYVYLYV